MLTNYSLNFDRYAEDLIHHVAVWVVIIGMKYSQGQKHEKGQYSAILTEQSFLIKELLYGQENFLTRTTEVRNPE